MKDGNKSKTKENALKKYVKEIPPVSSEKLRIRRTLKGHVSKVYAIHWAKHRNFIISAAQDGNLIIWDAFSTNKYLAIPTKSPYMMTCAYAPSGNLVASGGLDNACTVYNLQSSEFPIPPHQELKEHDAFVSCCRFFDDQRIVSCSGDKSCILWDIETGEKFQQMVGHQGPVNSLDIQGEGQGGTMISGASDGTIKLWDTRTGKCQHTFKTHSDVSSVQFFPNGYAFGAGCEDSSCQLFDIRTNANLLKLGGEGDPVLSIAFSKSGRFLFAGYENSLCCAWDTLKGNQLYQLHGHEYAVSSVGVSSDGMALCTGSWDCLLRIWA